jgi:hypothetical protein
MGFFWIPYGCVGFFAVSCLRVADRSGNDTPESAPSACTHLDHPQPLLQRILFDPKVACGGYMRDENQVDVNSPLDGKPTNLANQGACVPRSSG